LRIWEPACGAGDMARELVARGVRLDWSTDLIDRGFGQGGIDFLTAPAPQGCDGIISNPPFNIADRFIQRAIGDHRFTYVALLLKATYWNAGRRISLHHRFPPTAYLPLGFRVDFTGEGQPPMDLFWCIWDARAAGTVRFQPLPKPARLPAAIADLFDGP
ncbi:MAG: class I SAM-dependent methyltransferase, partial [Sphingomonadales bacterium]